MKPLNAMHFFKVEQHVVVVANLPQTTSFPFAFQKNVKGTPSGPGARDGQCKKRNRVRENFCGWQYFGKFKTSTRYCNEGKYADLQFALCQ